MFMRKHGLIAALLAVSMPFHSATARSGDSRTAAVLRERQPIADRGDGYYKNPVIAGNYADVGVVRVGDDYFLVHCCGDPRGMLVWHSRDLVNWEPYSRIAVDIPGSIWAPDLDYHDGFFYLYLPMMDPGNGHVWAMRAKSMKGPWSKPADTGIAGIDPGYIRDSQRNQFLYVDGGRVAPLSADALTMSGPVKKVYEGWQYPEIWTVQCFCSEAPKLIYHGNYFYLITAQGGTDGPSTSHMAVVARSQSPTGPWENSPHNPIIRTDSRAELWWSQGHGVLIDDVDGNWWMLYHAIENGYRSLGRQTLLVPIVWTSDGWPRLAEGTDSAGLLKKPAGENIGDGMPISDDFEGGQLGPQWNYGNVQSGDVIHSDRGQLVLPSANSESISHWPYVFTYPVNHSFEVQVQVTISEKSGGGLMLASPERAVTGVLFRKGELVVYTQGREQLKVNWPEKEAFLKVIDGNHDISAFYSKDDKEWNRFDFGWEFDGLTQTMIELVSSGKDVSAFRNFVYHGLD